MNRCGYEGREMGMNFLNHTMRTVAAVNIRGQVANSHPKVISNIFRPFYCKRSTCLSSNNNSTRIKSISLHNSLISGNKGCIEMPGQTLGK